MKKQMTEKEYRDLGFRLEIARLITLRAYIDLSQTRPRASKAVKLAEKAMDTIGKLKSELDNEVCRRAKELGIAEPTRVFYGGNQANIATVYTLLDELSPPSTNSTNWHGKD